MIILMIKVNEAGADGPPLLFRCFFKCLKSWKKKSRKTPPNSLFARIRKEVFALCHFQILLTGFQVENSTV